MKSSEEFMNNFMNKLNNGKLTIDKEPKLGNPYSITNEEIKRALSEYDKVLKSDIFNNDTSSNSTKKILIIEDDEDKFETIFNVLESKLDNPIVYWRRTKKTGLEALENNFDCVICSNYMLVDDNSYNLEPCAEYIANEVKEINPETIIIVCTSDLIDNIDNADFIIDIREIDDIFNEIYKENCINKIIKNRC